MRIFRFHKRLQVDVHYYRDLIPLQEIDDDDDYFDKIVAHIKAIPGVQWQMVEPSEKVLEQSPNWVKI